jgi:hypothetical protein
LPMRKERLQTVTESLTPAYSLFYAPIERACRLRQAERHIPIANCFSEEKKAKDMG